MPEVSGPELISAMAYEFQKQETAPAGWQEAAQRLGLPDRAMDRWLADRTLAWLPDKGLETLNACFDMAGEALSAGERRDTGGRIGYLLQGTLRLREGGTDRPVTPGTLLGIRRDSRGRKVPAPSAITAAEDAVVIWWRFDVVETVCYQACWFHARLIRELEELLKRE